MPAARARARARAVCPAVIVLALGVSAVALSPLFSMTMHENGNDPTYNELERRALFDLPDEPDEAPPDLIGELRGEAAADAADLTLGGYIAMHDRVPAFEGSDGQPYTVDIDVENDDSGFVAFFVFVRWAATGAGIMDHVESGDIGRADTEDGARHAALDLSLYEIKAELDAAIARRREALED